MRSLKALRSVQGLFHFRASDMAQAGPERSDSPRVKRMSDKGRAWLASLEGGCKLAAYRDSAGIPTIGVGLTYWPTSRLRVEIGQRISTKAEGMAMFALALRAFEATVDACTDDGISQEAFDAFTSFAYNIGQRAFAGSSAVRLFNQGAPSQAVANAMGLWNRAGGSVSLGLSARRDCEADLLVHGVYRLQGQKVGWVARA